MKKGKLIALALVPALLATGCVATTTSTTTWGADPYAESWSRPGRVASIRMTVRRQHGDPEGGAVAGAIIGGLLGHAFSGGHAGGAVVGAIGGAMVGSSASQGVAEDRFYEVFVRFDDGGYESFVYREVLPFRVGDGVTLTPQGLARM
jgi:outer membrane lipoprotein SlyB